MIEKRTTPSAPYVADGVVFRYPLVREHDHTRVSGGEAPAGKIAACLVLIV